MMSDPNPKPKLRRTGRSLPIALLRARETVMGPIRDMLAESAVNEQKWRVLRVLDESGPMEMSEVAKAACLLLPSLTRISRAMADDGLIDRAGDPGDRRKSVLAITTAGRQVILDHTDASAEIFTRLEQRFGRQRLDLLLDLLEELRRIDLQPDAGNSGNG